MKFYFEVVTPKTERRERAEKRIEFERLFERLLAVVRVLFPSFTAFTGYPERDDDTDFDIGAISPIPQGPDVDVVVVVDSTQWQWNPNVFKWVPFAAGVKLVKQENVHRHVVNAEPNLYCDDAMLHIWEGMPGQCTRCGRGSRG